VGNATRNHVGRVRNHRFMYCTSLFQFECAFGYPMLQRLVSFGDQSRERNSPAAQSRGLH
jgi:hypothetical protein